MAKFIQIACKQNDVLALDDDGLVWRLTDAGFTASGREAWVSVTPERERRPGHDPDVPARPRGKPSSPQSTTRPEDAQARYRKAMGDGGDDDDDANGVTP